jgi:16S rRNA (cytosine967-C5)-methyltransferase
MGAWSDPVTASRRHPPEVAARDAALDILERVEAGRGHSNALLANLPADMPERDRALCTELVYGVQRRRAVLDESIAAVSRRPLESIDRRLLGVLRIAAYQILVLTRVPWPAAVDEAVRTAKARGGAGSGSFANGVLRALCRAVEAGTIPTDRPRPDPRSRASGFRDWLAREVSFPLPLVDRYLDRHGSEEAEALLRALNQPGSEALARALAAEGVATVPSPVLPGALRVVRGVPQRTKAFGDGAFYIQDEAAQMVALLLEPLNPSVRLIDLCAAPGGKILQAADTLERASGMLLAADRSPRRLRRLRENASRMGLAWIQCVAMEVEKPALRGRFDRVLLDAPCSGTGVIRRHPEIRWRRTMSDIRRHAAAQDRALRAASGLLAPEGRLVYAVCSLEPEEGPERIDALLRERGDLKLIDARLILPDALHRFVNGRGALETLPHRDDVDGFFAAVLSLC